MENNFTERDNIEFKKIRKTDCQFIDLLRD
jgi:hypothetical protein